MRPPKKAAKRKTSSQPKKDPRPQGQRFIEFAKEVGADDDGKAMEGAFKRAVPAKKPKR